MGNEDIVRIRTDLRPGDLGYLTYLHGKLYAEEYGYGLGFESYVMTGLGEFGTRYNPPRDRVWICEDPKERVGYLVSIHRGDAMQLRYFLLLPAYRGKGWGRKLMELFIEHMAAQGLTKAYLWTTHEQETAAALYTRFNFKLTEEKPSSAFGKELTERRYDLDISASSSHVAGGDGAPRSSPIRP